MFKRIFIGLLILSALTAEGKALLYVAHTHLPGYMAGLYSEENEKAPDTNDMPEKTSVQEAVRYGIHAFVSVDEIIDDRDNVYMALFLPFEFSSLYCPLLCGQAPANNALIPENGYILCASDISPPFGSRIYSAGI